MSHLTEIIFEMQSRITQKLKNGRARSIANQ